MNIPTKHTWLITGAAGFIGSHIAEELLKSEQKVIGFDNLSYGFESKINYLKNLAGGFHFIKGDITSPLDCEKAVKGVDFILHHAALCSVPESIEKPNFYNQHNIQGFQNILMAAKEEGVKRIVYASSSAVYGNKGDFGQAKNESDEIFPLSPYAASKAANEAVATAFSQSYDIDCVGLRYFNVFGHGQNVNGPYAAVIAKWVERLLSGASEVDIYGDGSTVRDFCYVKDVVRANLLATLTTDKEAKGQIYNVGTSRAVSLNDLFLSLKNVAKDLNILKQDISINYKDFREGDIHFSLASIDKAKRFLEFSPKYSLEQGLYETLSALQSKSKG